MKRFLIHSFFLIFCVSVCSVVPAVNYELEDQFLGLVPIADMNRSLQVGHRKLTAEGQWLGERVQLFVVNNSNHTVFIPLPEGILLFLLEGAAWHPARNTTTYFSLLDHDGSLLHPPHPFNDQNTAFISLVPQSLETTDILDNSILLRAVVVGTIVGCEPSTDCTVATYVDILLER